MFNPTRLFKFFSTASLIFLNGCTAEFKPDRFIIASANLDGSDYKIIQKDVYHNMTHPRVSPDGKRIVFTKYFQKNIQGLCLEDDGYFNTEIVVSNIDGSAPKTLVAHKEGVMNANCSWIDDNHIIFIHCAPPAAPQILSLDLNTKVQKILPTQESVIPSDPHRVGDMFVYATIDSKNKNANSIWISNADGTDARQISHPENEKNNDGKFNLGDYDPRLSPDGKHLCFMRYFGNDTWRIFTVDLSKPNQKEIEINPSLPGAWAVPDWTCDSKKLVCFHVDKNDLKSVGIWLMNPDGSSASKINLPKNYFVHNPNTYFDPVNNQIRVIYGGKFNPGL